MPLVPVDAVLKAAAKTVAHGAVQVELRAAVHSKIVLVHSKRRNFLHSTRTSSSADLALQTAGAIAAAEYGRLAM